MRRPDRISTDVSRRTIIRGTTAGLFALSGIGTAAAHDEEDGSTEESEEGGDGEEDGGEEPTANVTFSDQTVANNDGGPTVTVDRLEMDEGGYQSIHQYSRFQFADGEDPEDYDVPVPEELDNPICESLIGITEYLPAGTYENLEVPLFRSDSPAVKLGAASVGSLDESQVMIAIPHYNTTDEDTFNCPDDPSTPNLFESGDEVDGAFQNGGRDVGDIGVVHDLATVFVESDDEERKEVAKRQEELIRKGILVPQPIGPNEETEDQAEEEENEDEEEEEEREDEEEEEEREDEEEERENEEKDEDGKARDGDDERKRDDESESDEEEDDDSSADEDDNSKRKAADESSDREGRDELPKQASDRARDARKDAPGFDG
ncbi:DUF7282 domain-containing protein [Halalkalicoccus ordinarius]|uniref:DUF7282 domain-containing protein n=1 Tax=Halalkalicoccus ordinarius TaxID=3116651 RepID=UPI00300F4C3A